MTMTPPRRKSAPPEKTEDSCPASLPDLREPVRRLITQMTGQSAFAEDLTQEVMLKAGKNLHQLRNPLRLEAWLFRIARNAVRDHLRRKATSAKVATEDPQGLDSLPSPGHDDAATREEHLLRDALDRYVRGVVESLPSPDRDVLLLTEFQGLTQAEAARRLKMPLPTLKSRVLRARGKVSRIIRACCDFQTDRYGRVLDYRCRKPRC